MAKPKLTDFRKYLSSLDEAGVRAELEKLFKKLPQVKEFYAQELMSEKDRLAMLEDYKKKIKNQYWTRSGNPRMPDNRKINQILSGFEKVSVFPHELIDLLLFRVETASDFANNFGGMPDAAYNSASRTFEKAVKLMAKHQLVEMFKPRCSALFEYDNLDYWYLEEMQEFFEDEIGG